MKKTKAFTLIEIIFVAIIISAGFFSIFRAVNNAQYTNQRVMQTIIANQLATEWTEIVYQLRNTNFLKHQYSDNSSQDINECRLALNYENCGNDGILYTWYYYTTTNIDWQNTIIPNPAEPTDDIFQDIYAICLNSWSWVPCPQWHTAWNDESKLGKFYRAIEWIWIYDMSSDTVWWELLDKNDLSDKNAQEYRFCSRVAWKWAPWWEVEICSTMTNFIE